MTRSFLAAVAVVGGMAVSCGSGLRVSDGSPTPEILVSEFFAAAGEGSIDSMWDLTGSSSRSELGREEFDRCWTDSLTTLGVESISFEYFPEQPEPVSEELRAFLVLMTIRSPDGEERWPIEVLTERSARRWFVLSLGWGATPAELERSRCGIPGPFSP